jgi:hypothetical protein
MQGASGFFGDRRKHLVSGVLLERDPKSATPGSIGTGQSHDVRLQLRIGRRPSSRLAPQMTRSGLHGTDELPPAVIEGVDQHSDLSQVALCCRKD